MRRVRVLSGMLAFKASRFTGAFFPSLSFGLARRPPPRRRRASETGRTARRVRARAHPGEACIGTRVCTTIAKRDFSESHARAEGTHEARVKLALDPYNTIYIYLYLTIYTYIYLYTAKYSYI